MSSTDAETLATSIREIATAYRIGRDALAMLRSLSLKALAGGLRLNRDELRVVRLAISDLSDAFGLHGVDTQPEQVVVGYTGLPSHPPVLVVALTHRAFPCGPGLMAAARAHDRAGASSLSDWLLDQDRLHNAAFAAGIHLDDLAESVCIAAQALRHRGGDDGERPRQ